MWSSKNHKAVNVNRVLSVNNRSFFDPKSNQVIFKMLPTTIHTAPTQGDFTPLSEYQSTTPQSFHDGKPVLHYHATGVKAWLPKDQQSRVPIFPADAPAFEGDSGEMISQDEVELFINSE